MKRAAGALSLLLVGVALNGVARADCGGRHLALVSDTVRVGQAITVHGTGIYTGRCYDDGGCHRDGMKRADGATLRLVGGTRSWSLGEFQPDKKTWDRDKTIVLPASASGQTQLQMLSKSGELLATAPLTIRPA